MGLGDTWGTAEELLHPRDKNGRFRSKWKMAEGVVKKLLDFLGRFNPHTFPNDAAAGSYLQNKAKPGRFGGGADYPRLTADFHAANGALRQGQMDAETRRFVSMMDASAIDAPDDLILTRTVGPEAFGLTPETMHLDEGGAEDLTGKLLADRGYGFAQLGTPQRGGPGTIRVSYAVPKGTKIIPRSEDPSDRGVFLDRDQEFRITKVTPDGNGGYYAMAVATDRTPGPTPEPMGGPAAPPMTPEARRVNIEQGRQIQAERMGAGAPELAQETPEQRAARRKGILAQGGAVPQPAPAGAPAAGVPSQSPTPAEVPTVPRPQFGPTPQPDFRAAVREAKLPAPSRGPRRSQWNDAFLGIASGKKDPADALRELESDIASNKRLLEDLRSRESNHDPELEHDIQAQEHFRDFLRDHFDLKEKAAPAEPAKAAKKAAKKAGVPETPPAKKVAKVAAKAAPAPAKKTAPKASTTAKAPPAPEGFKRTQVGQGHGLERLHEGTPSGVAEPSSKEGRVAVGRGHATTRAEESKAPPRPIAEPSDKKRRVQVGEQSHATPTKRQAVGTPAPVGKNVPKKVDATKATREEEKAAADNLRQTIDSLPEGSPQRAESQKLLDQMEQDFQDDEVVAEWVKGSGVQERSLTEPERAHVARVARDVRTGKISPQEGAKDLRTGGNEKLDKIARRVEGGEAVKTPRTKKEKIDELDSMTSPELKAQAKAEGIRGYSKMNKEAIKQAIRDKRGGGGEAAAPEVPTGDQFENMNVTNLRKAAKDKGIKGYSRMKREDLQKALRGESAPEAPASTAPTKAAPAGLEARREQSLRTRARREQALQSLRDQGIDNPSSTVLEEQMRTLADIEQRDLIRQGSGGGVAKVAKKAAPPAENPTIAEARSSQAKIDAKRQVARSVAEIDERIANNDEKINAPELHRTIDNLEKSGQLDPASAEAWRQAVDSGDTARLRAAIETEASAAGLRPIGRSAEKVVFNPKEHKLLSNSDRPGPGESVEIVRQGHRDADGNVIEKAIVQPSGEKVKVPERPKASPADRVTAHVLDRMSPEVRAQVLDSMTPKERDAVRDAVARATGKILDPTDQEIRDLEAKIEQVRIRRSGKGVKLELPEEILKGSPDDIREAAKKEGLGPLKGDTTEEVLHDAFRQLAKAELEAKKAAPAKKAAAPKRPAGAFENLDVKEIGKGIDDLDLIPPGVMKGLQEDLDSGKLTPAVIGRQLEQTTSRGMGPAHQRAVLHGVAITSTRQRIADLEKEAPSEDRDQQLAYWRARQAENEAESAKLTRQIDARLKLAERLKATRRKRATAPAPEPATLTPREEARAAEVADLAGVPEAKVQARMKAQKEEKAPASDAGKHIVDLLGASSSRAEADALLEGKTKLDLVDIAKAHGIPAPASKTKPVLRREIVDAAVGRRLDSIATRGFTGARPGEGESTPTHVLAPPLGSMGGTPRSRTTEGMTADEHRAEAARLLAEDRHRPGAHGQSETREREAEAARNIRTAARMEGKPVPTHAEAIAEARAAAEKVAPAATPAAPETPVRQPVNAYLPGKPTVSASRLVTGERIWAMPGEGGTWDRTSRKTGGAKPITVTRIEPVGGGRQREYIIHGRDDDGNEVTLGSLFGQNTLTRAPRAGTKAAPAKKAAPAPAVPQAPKAAPAAPTPAKKAAPAAAPESIHGPLKRNRPEYEAGRGSLGERPNADEPLKLRGGQMSGTGDLHADSQLGELWQDLYQDDRTPNSLLNKISDLAHEMAIGDRPFGDIMRDLHRLTSATTDVEVAKRIQKAIANLDAPETGLPSLPEGTPDVVRKALEELHSIPLARKTGRVGATHRDTSVLDAKLDVVRKIAAGDARPEDLMKHDLHESTDGAYRMWRLFDRLSQSPEVRKWSQEARKKAHAPKPVTPERSQNIGDFTPAEIMRMSIPHMRDLAIHRGIAGAKDMKKNELLEKLLDLLG